MLSHCPPPWGSIVQSRNSTLVEHPWLIAWASGAVGLSNQALRLAKQLGVAQKLSLVMGRSLPVSVVWLLMRLRFRFILDRSLSNTSPERSADTRSSNSPPSSSPFSLAFRAFLSFSLCSFSCGRGGVAEHDNSTAG